MSLKGIIDNLYIDNNANLFVFFAELTMRTTTIIDIPSLFYYNEGNPVVH